MRRRLRLKLAGAALFLPGCAAGAKQGLALGMLFLILAPVLLAQILACLAAWKQSRPAWSLVPVVLLMLAGFAGGGIGLAILADASPTVRERVALESFLMPALESFAIVAMGLSVLGYAWERAAPSVGSDATSAKPRNAKPYVILACLACVVGIVVPTIVLCSEPAQLMEPREPAKK